MHTVQDFVPVKIIVDILVDRLHFLQCLVDYKSLFYFICQKHICLIWLGFLNYSYSCFCL